MSLWVPFVLQMKEVTNHLEEQESKLVRFFFPAWVSVVPE